MQTVKEPGVFSIENSSENQELMAIVPGVDLEPGDRIEVRFPTLHGQDGKTVELTISTTMEAGEAVILDLSNNNIVSQGKRSVKASWEKLEFVTAQVISTDAETSRSAEADGNAPEDAVAPVKPVVVEEAEAGADGAAPVSFVFVDGSLANVDQIIEGIDAGHQVHVVTPGVDGVAFMASVLSGESGVNEVHVISHGDEGEFRLGSSTVDTDSINAQHSEELATISDALADGADFLIYGCNFGADEEAVAALADALGADVAASSDVTGHASLGGDWDLEVKNGEIEADTALSQEGQESWNGVLGNFSLDWSSLVWTNGDLTNTYTLTGSTGQTVDVTITVAEITNSPVPFTFNSIQYPAEDPASGGFLGGVDDLMIVTDPLVDALAQLSITVAFTEGGSGSGGTAVNLDNINFLITDIDWRQNSGNNSQDQVTITSDGNVALSEVNAADNTVAISGNVAFADIQSASNNDDRGSVNVNITDGATGFTIVYEDIVASGEPSVRGIGVLGGFSFSGTPSPDTDTTAQDTTLTVNAASGVLSNDSDTSGTLTLQTFTVDGISGTFNAGDTVNMAEGDLTLNADGSYTFVPSSGFSGTVPQVTYTVHDGAAVESTTLDITVTPVSPAPVWNISGPLQVVEGNTASYTLNLVNQDTMNPGDSVSVDLSIADVDTTSADYANFLGAVGAAAATDPNYTLVGNTLTYTEPTATSGYSETFTAGGASGVTSIVGQSGTTALNLGDDQTSNQSIGFDFNFYGTDYSSINVDSNGYVTFGGAPGSTFNNGDIAAGTALGGNPAIAAFWDDLSPNQAGDVYVRTTGSPGSQQFIVEWSGVPYYNGGNTDGGTIQLVLDEATGTVEIHYLDVDFNGSNTSHDNALSATLGIQDGSGTGIEYSQDANIANLSGATLTYAPPVASGPYAPLALDLGTVDDPDYEGDEDYQITLSNAGGGSSIGLGSVTTTIMDNENPPVARDDAEVTDQDTVVSDSVLVDNGNGVDSDPDGDSLTVTEVNGQAADIGNQITLPSGAMLTLNSNGTYSYDPNGQFDGLGSGETDTDTFTYTISDGTGGTDTATVTITINGVNDAPVQIIDQTVNTYYDAMLNCGFWSHAGVVAGSVLVDLDHVVDPDVNDTHTFTIVNGSGTPVADPDFEIVNNELVIRSGSSLVPGVVTNRSVIVRVDDGNGGTHDRTYTFDLELDTGSYVGSTGNDFAFGTVGADTMTGGDGLDRLFGDDGNDNLQGGAGNDILDGGVGADVLNGGAGTDGASYMSSSSAIVADLANSAANTGDAAGDSYTDIEMLWGSGFNDNLSGDGGHNVLVGDAGDDVLIGRGGNDNLYGGLGNDTLIISNGDGNDTAYAFTAGAGTGDVVDISDFGFANFAAVQSAMSVVGGHVVLQLDGDDSIRFFGVSNTSDLHADDFLI